MFTRVTVEVPHLLLLELLEHLKSRRDPCNIDRAMVDALRSWLLTQTGKAPVEPGVRGYQWKMLFLPEGTCLRSWCYGEHNYARVVGDEIIFDGRAVTPNQFARAHARTERNAWRDLFIKRPEDKKWQIASRLRQQLLADEANNRPAGTPLAVPRKTAGDRMPARKEEPRCTGPVPGWDLPERRKYRIRLEDFE